MCHAVRLLIRVNIFRAHEERLHNEVQSRAG